MSDRRGLRLGAAVLCATGVLLAATLLLARPARAAGTTIVVNTTSDASANDGACSLREAIVAANTDTVSGAAAGECAAGSGSDTITLPAGTYTLTVSSLSVSSTITIQGAGVTTTFVQACTAAQTGADACGAGALAGETGVADRVFSVSGGGNLTLESLTVRNGRIVGEGGAILNQGSLTLTDVAVRDSAAVGALAGGIRSEGPLTITNSTIDGNRAEGAGGLRVMAGTFTMTRSSVTNNTSTATNAGGGMLISTASAVVIANSTISGNSTLGGAGGGGIYTGGTSVSIVNTTFANNSASTGNGRDLYVILGTTTLTNTLIANTSTNGCFKSGGTLTDGGHNLVQDGSCAADLGGAITGDPMIGSLADNGGSTQTHALLSGSPAIGAGSNATCAASPVSGVDQRGTSRPQGATCDIGAFEFVQAVYTPPPSVETTIPGLGPIALEPWSSRLAPTTGGLLLTQGPVGPVTFDLPADWGGTVVIAGAADPTTVARLLAGPPVLPQPLFSFALVATPPAGAGAPGVSFEVYLPKGTATADLTLGRWDGAAWQLVDATADAEAGGRTLIGATLPGTGIFSLFVAPTARFALVPGFNAFVWSARDATAADAAALLPAGTITALFELDPTTQTWLVYIPGAPDGVSTLTSIHAGDVLIVSAGASATWAIPPW